MCFNSYMVRLREFYKIKHDPCEGCFNSYMVRLRDISRIGLISFVDCFNSYMVRLRVNNNPSSPIGFIVSIPIW